MSVLKLIKASLITLLLLFAHTAKAQLKDTAIYYLRQLSESAIAVTTEDSADYIRVIPSFKKNDDIVEIRDYYKDGKIKLVGRLKVRSFNKLTGDGYFEGPCLSYYQNGRRKSIITYNRYGKDGLEYQYYPNGKLFTVTKNKANSYAEYPMGQLIDCYDSNGEQICENGLGSAIKYDKIFNEVVMKGPIEDGKKEGIWKGNISFMPLAHFDLVYKDGGIVSGIGYDSTGKSYRFDKLISNASYIDGTVEYISQLKHKLKHYKFSSERVDSLIITFIVKEDGELDQINISNDASPEILQALKKSIKTLGNWSPMKLYGIPLQAKGHICLKVFSIRDKLGYHQSADYNLKPMYKGKELIVSVWKEINFK